MSRVQELQLENCSQKTAISRKIPLALSILQYPPQNKHVINILPNLQAYFDKRRYFPILMSTFGEDLLFFWIKDKFLIQSKLIYLSDCTNSHNFDFVDSFFVQCDEISGNFFKLLLLWRAASHWVERGLF